MAEKPFRFKRAYSSIDHKLSDSETDDSENEGYRFIFYCNFQ